jgi:hypothetical protein
MADSKAAKKRTLQWVKRKVALRFWFGKKLFEMDCLGGWAYHPEIDRAFEFSKDPRRWVILHIASGKEVVRTNSPYHAQMCVEFLVERWPQCHGVDRDDAKKSRVGQALWDAHCQGEIFFYHGEEPAHIQLQNFLAQKEKLQKEQLIRALMSM